MPAEKLLTVSRTLTLGTVLLALVGLAAPAAGVTRYGDFNGDGHSDLAVGVPNESNNVHGAGAVNVIYGAAPGLRATGNQIWHQAQPDVLDSPELDDAFGAALVTGDFNGDGFDDLAVGIPGETVGVNVAAGAVQVFYGSAAGLVAAGNQLWHQDSTGIADAAEANDFFGLALGTGDFDGDGFSDLAVGVPGEDAEAGLVHVIHGSLTGLVSGGSQIWRQGGLGLADAAEAGDGFGSALAGGDFDGDGFDDLAIGVPGEDFVRLDGRDVFDAGAVAALYGHPFGLDAVGNQIWTQDTPEIVTVSEDGDLFGAVLAAGDFNGDGCDDLAVGVPLDNTAVGVAGGFVGQIFDAGGVNVIYGFHEGLHVYRNQWFGQDAPGIADTSEAGDHFGGGLATGDFDGDGFDDLAIGVPHETFGKPGKDILGAGVVHVLYGREECLHADRSQLWHQGSQGIPEGNEDWDLFGASLTSGDFDGDGFADLVIGVFNESVGSAKNAGAATTIYGRSTGLHRSGAQIWTQNTTDVLNQSKPFDAFGFAVAGN